MIQNIVAPHKGETNVGTKRQAISEIQWDIPNQGGGWVSPRGGFLTLRVV